MHFFYAVKVRYCSTNFEMKFWGFLLSDFPHTMCNDSAMLWWYTWFDCTSWCISMPVYLVRWASPNFWETFLRCPGQCWLLQICSRKLVLRCWIVEMSSINFLSFFIFLIAVSFHVFLNPLYVQEKKCYVDNSPDGTVYYSLDVSGARHIFQPGKSMQLEYHHPQQLYMTFCSMTEW